MTAIIQSGINKIITLPAGQDKLERWNNQFIESTKLAKEAGIEFIILPDK